MKAQICVTVDELKDGEWLAKLGDKVLGDISDLDVENEVEMLYYYVKANQLLDKIDFLKDIRPQVDKKFGENIKELLAKLLAYYSIDA